MREAQSNLALLWELDRHGYQIVAQFTEAWVNHCLEFKPAPAEGSNLILFQTKEA